MGASTSMRSPSASTVCARCPAAMNSPFTAVLTTLPPYPSSSSAPASSSRCVSRQAPFTRIFIHHLRIVAPLEQHICGATRQRRCQQVAVPVEPVDVQRAAYLTQARQIVGKCGAHPGTDLEDLRLAEGRMQCVCRR